MAVCRADTHTGCAPRVRTWEIPPGPGPCRSQAPRPGPPGITARSAARAQHVPETSSASSLPLRLAEEPLGATAPGLMASQWPALWGTTMASAPAEPPPSGWQGHEPAIHKHVGAPTVHQACATEARSGELTRPWQTGHAPGTAGPDGRQPGQAPPESAGSEGHGGGKAAAGACYLAGGHLTPRAPASSSVRWGKYCLPHRASVRGKRRRHTSAPRTRPARTARGARALSPDPARTAPAMRVPSHTGDTDMLELTLPGHTGQAVGAGSSPCTRAAALNPRVGRGVRDPPPSSPTPSHSDPGTAKARASGPEKLGFSAARPHQLCDLQLPEPRAPRLRQGQRPNLTGTERTTPESRVPNTR